MIGVAIGLKAELNETIDYSEHFTVHLLKEGQEDWIEKFAHDSKIADGKINGVPFTKKDHALILKGTLGYITCKVEKSVNNGDHTFHIGTVIDTHLEDAASQPICSKETSPNYTIADAAV
jgi:flavin reductase (DIM6/NTAB) family NADH-FMN oxidoreductase RutF